MAKKAANPALVASENVSEEVVTSTVLENSDAPATPETEATTPTAIDQPAVTDGASASPSSDVVPPKDEASEEEAAQASSSPAEPAIPEVVAIQGGGGSFESPFAESKPALTMVERIELLEKRVAELEAK